MAYSFITSEVLNSDFRNSAKEFVSSNHSLRDGVIGKYPDTVLTLLKDADVRPFWYDNMQYFQWHEYKPLFYLLESGKIPDSELPELFEKLQKFLYKNNYPIIRDDQILTQALKNRGYFRQFFETYITKDYLSEKSMLREICYKTEFFITHLYEIDLSEDNVKQLVKLLPQKEHSPYTLFERFVNEVCNDSNFRDRLKESAAQHNILLPSTWNID